MAGGRPKTPLDEKAIVAMAERGWNMHQIAIAMGVDHHTISRRFAQKIADAQQHGRAKLMDVLWQRAIQSKSDRILTHLADRILGKVPQKLELTDESVDSYIRAKEATNGSSTEVETKEK